MDQSSSNCARCFCRSVSVTDFFIRSLRRRKFSRTSASMSVARETAIGVGGRANDRFAANVEAGIDQNGTAGLAFKSFHQPVEAPVPRFVHGLKPRAASGWFGAGKHLIMGL